MASEANLPILCLLLFCNEGLGIVHAKEGSIHVYLYVKNIPCISIYYQ